MSSLTLSRKNLIPSWTNELFDTGNFFGPNLLDFDEDFQGWNLASRIPTVNIIENTKDYKFELAAPGMEKKDFHVKIENDMLVISSEKKEETKEEKENYMRREFSYNSFSRSFRLPENCLPDKVDAKYENGILRIVLPKKEVTIIKPAKEIKVL